MKSRENKTVSTQQTAELLIFPTTPEVDPHKRKKPVHRTEGGLTQSSYRHIAGGGPYEEPKWASRTGRSCLHQIWEDVRRGCSPSALGQGDARRVRHRYTGSGGREEVSRVYTGSGGREEVSHIYTGSGGREEVSHVYTGSGGREDVSRVRGT